MSPAADLWITAPLVERAADRDSRSPLESAS